MREFIIEAIKNPTLKNFLKDNEANLELFNAWIESKEENLLNELNERFKCYLLKIYFCAYISKSIKYKSIEMKKHNKFINEMEELSLNSVEPDFKEEKLANIIDDKFNIIEAVYYDNKDLGFEDIVTNKILLDAIHKLTEKQRMILQLFIIKNKTDKEISKELQISIQAVNKCKKAAIKKIKAYVEECL